MTPRGAASPTPWNDCITWDGRLTADGYGIVGIAKRNLRAHRIAWIVERGPIPNGLQIDHLCRNRACINTQHMELVTQAENNRRGNSFSAVNSRKTHCAKGHSLDAPDVIRLRGKRMCRICQQAHSRAHHRRVRLRVLAQSDEPNKEGAKP